MQFDMSNFWRAFVRARSHSHRSCSDFFRGKIRQRQLLGSDSLECVGCFSTNPHSRLRCKKWDSKRFFNSSTVKCLQLKDGISHRTWIENFWKIKAARKKFLVSTGKLNPTSDKLLKIRPSFDYFFYGFDLVLVKEAEDFVAPDSEESWLECFQSPNVIATTFLSWRGQVPVVIENRWNTIEEWETLLGPVLEKCSRNITLSSVMEFILLQYPKRFRIDESVNPKDQLTTPLVESLLEFLYLEQNVEFCERSLVPYFLACKDNNHFDLIEKEYGRAKASVKIFGPVFMGICMDVLAITKWWKDIYTFSDVLRESGVVVGPSLEYKTALAVLRNDDYETALGLVGNYLHQDHRCHSPSTGLLLPILLSKFRYSEDPKIWKRNREVVEGFFMVLAEKGLFPESKNAAQDITNWFTQIRDESWQFSFFSSEDIGLNFCPLTGVKLKKKWLSEEEYDYLTKVVLKHILLRKHQQSEASITYSLGESYVNAAQREVKSFLSVIYEKGPFDIVIDGMNLYYNIQKKISDKNLVRPSELASAWLRNHVLTLERNTGQQLKVLVIFRHHLRREVRYCFDEVATVWYAADEANDDPFFLYAALLSGRNCKMLTLDCMRDVHGILASAFDYRTVKLIYKWQQIHQDLVILKHTEKKTPQHFDVSIQRTENTWHFPYYDESKSPVPNKWLALKRTS